MATNQKNLEFSSPQLSVQIGSEVIPVDYVKRLDLFYSIKKLCPSGVLTLQGLNGSFLNSFKLRQGQSVFLRADNAYHNAFIQEKDRFNFSEFRIEYINYDFEDDSKNLSGNIQIFLKHPWELSQDFTAHAYPRQPNNKLIEQILSEGNRGFYLPYSTDDIVSTDDLGKRPKYKFNSGDKDFIEHELLPFCSSEKEACYAFITESGYFHLTTFRNILTSKKPTIAFITEVEEFSPDQIANLEIPNITRFFPSEVKVGGENSLKGINAKFLLDFEADQKVKGANKTFTSKSSEQGPHYFPIDSGFVIPFKSGQASDKRIYHHRYFDDLNSLDSQLHRDQQHLLKIRGVTDFTNQTEIGDTVYIYIPYKNGKESEFSWLNGSWIVESVYYFIDGITKALKEEVVLTLPNLPKVVDDKNVSFKDQRNKLTQF